MLRGITILHVRRKALRLPRVNDRLLRDEEDHSLLFFYPRPSLPYKLDNEHAIRSLARRSSDRIARPDTVFDEISMKEYRTTDPCYYEGMEEEIDPTRSREIVILR